jgi:hypothetical protein
LGLFGRHTLGQIWYHRITDCLQSEHDAWDKEVIVYWYDHTKFPPDAFVADVEQANRALLKKDIVALEDHPVNLKKSLVELR